MDSLSLLSFFSVTQLSWRWGEEKRNTGVTAVAAAAVVAVVLTSVADNKEFSAMLRIRIKNLPDPHKGSRSNTKKRLKYQFL